MTTRLTAALGGVLLAAACDSGLSGLPTPVPPNAGTPIQGVPVTPPGGGPTPITGTSLRTGMPVEGTIGAGDPPCFYNWDATGLCRQFDLTALADGKLVATLGWTGPSRGLYDPDIFLVDPSGAWVVSQGGWPEKQASLVAKSGLTYRIVVMSYGPSAQAFVLRVDLVREGLVVGSW